MPTPLQMKRILVVSSTNRSIIIIRSIFWYFDRPFSQKARSTVDWARWRHKALLRGASVKSGEMSTDRSRFIFVFMGCSCWTKFSLVLKGAVWLWQVSSLLRGLMWRIQWYWSLGTWRFLRTVVHRHWLLWLYWCCFPWWQGWPLSCSSRQLSPFRKLTLICRVAQWVRQVLSCFRLSGQCHQRSGDCWCCAHQSSRCPRRTLEPRSLSVRGICWRGKGIADTPVSLQWLSGTSRRYCCLLEPRTLCSRIKTQSDVLGCCEYCVSSTLAVRSRARRGRTLSWSLWSCGAQQQNLRYWFKATLTLETRIG